MLCVPTLPGKKLGKFRCGHRAGEHVTLDDVASRRLQKCHLLGRLDALGNRGHPVSYTHLTLPTT